MRLYLKLFAMVTAALVIQTAIGGPGEWVDETQFAIRVYVSGRLGVPSHSPQLLDAASSLRRRQLARLGLPPIGVPSLEAPPAHAFAADDVCDESGAPWHPYALGGQS